MQSSKVKLAFACDQGLDRMSVDTSGGYFCSQCQKRLHDFRSTPLKEVWAITSQQEGCGIFTAEQVEKESVTIFSINALKHYIWAMVTWLVAESSYALPSTDTTYTSIRTIKEGTEPQSPVPAAVPQKKKEKNSSLKPLRKNRIKTRRSMEYGIFYRKRFPFIVFKQEIYRPRFLGFWKYHPNREEQKPKKNGLVIYKRK